MYFSIKWLQKQFVYYQSWDLFICGKVSTLYIRQHDVINTEATRLHSQPGSPAPRHIACILWISSQPHHHMEPPPQPLARVCGSPEPLSVIGMIAWRLFWLPCPRVLWAAPRSVVLSRTPPLIFTAQNHFNGPCGLSIIRKCVLNMVERKFTFVGGLRLKITSFYLQL